MDDRKWKRENKPASCTQAPWAIFIPPMDRPEILRKIRQETIDNYGYSMDECTNRKICITKACIGRPLPWLSETAKPLLEKLGVEEGENYFVKTDCQECPLFNSCSNPCNQIFDFIERNKTLEPEIKYEDSLENIIPSNTPLEESILKVKPEDIPWDILSARKKKVIKKYLYEERDFRYVADATNLYNQAAAKYEFYSALTKLAEYGVFRKFLKEHSHSLTARQLQILEIVYKGNKKLVEAASELGVSKQSIQQTIARVIKKYDIKWHKFVRKQGNKTIYNTLEVLK